jgi:hypothetical protein
MSLNDLPAELLSEVAEYLSADHKHRSLANLNQACRRLRDVTVPALYRTLILFRTDHERLEESAILKPVDEGEPMPDAWRHTR